MFISQYIERGGFNKSIELFNGTDETVDLSLYTLSLYSDGESGDPSQSLTLEGTLETGEVFVVSHGSADPDILAETDLINNSTINFDGNDVIALRKNIELIDLFGIIGSSVDFAVDVNLIRQVTVVSGRDLFEPLEWLRKEG